MSKKQATLIAGDAPRRIDSNSTLKEIEPAFEAFMKDSGFSIHSVKAFISDLRLLAEFLGSDTAVGAVSTEDLNKFLYWMRHERGKPCSDKTYARRVTTFKVMFKWLVEHEILVVNPAAKVAHIQITTPIPIVPTHDEIARALAVTEMWRVDGHKKNGMRPDARPQMLLMLLLQTGVKKGEAVNVALEHVERDTDTPYIFIKYKNPRMVNKERKLPVDETWLAIFDEYVAQYEPENQQEKTLFTCTARNLEYILTDVGEEAGLAPGLMSFEILRWTAAIRDLQAGISDDTVRQKQGLSKITWRERRKKLNKIVEAQNIKLP